MLAIGLPLSALFAGGDNNNGRRPANKSKAGTVGPIVANYLYKDAQHVLRMRVTKHDPKTFRQSRPRVENPRLDVAADWVWSVKDEQKIPYNLPAILAAPPASAIYIVEGEKDADNLNARGLIATTNPGGAGKWPDTQAFKEPFLGHHIDIVEDNDDVGRQHAHDVAGKLKSVARSIKTVSLPGLPLKGDVSDWLEAGGTVAQLEAIAAATRHWEETPIKPVERPDDPHRLARLVLAEFRRVVYWREEIYVMRSEGPGRQADIRYQKLSRSEWRSVVGRIIKEEFDRLNVEAIRESPGKMHFAEKVTNQLIANVQTAISCLTSISDDIELDSWLDDQSGARRQDWITLRNGIFKIDAILAGKPADEFLVPHDPHWFSIVALPFDFAWDADCPTFRAYLSSSVPNRDHQALLQEWAGYLLTPTTDQQKFLILEGEGANGKSVYCAATEAVLGSQNCSHLAVERMADQFQLAEMYGRLANICADIGGIDPKSEGLLKSLVSGDKLNHQRKFRDGFNATPTARLMIATNNRPRFSDKSSGIWRRMLLVPFTTVIPEADRIVGLDKVSFWQNRPAELAGIFNWALEGLQRLRANGRFTIPDSCRQAVEGYRDDNNPARAFLLDHYAQVEGEEAFINAKDTYGAYRGFCDSNGFQALSSIAFGREVLRTFPGVERVRLRIQGEREYVFTKLVRSSVLEGGHAS